MQNRTCSLFFHMKTGCLTYLHILVLSVPGLLVHSSGVMKSVATVDQCLHVCGQLEDI